MHESAKRLVRGEKESAQPFAIKVGSFALGHRSPGFEGAPSDEPATSLKTRELQKRMIYFCHLSALRNSAAIGIIDSGNSLRRGVQSRLGRGVPARSGLPLSAHRALVLGCGLQPYMGAPTSQYRPRCPGFPPDYNSAREKRSHPRS